MSDPNFAIKRHVPIAFSDMLDRVPVALGHHGLGVLGEIDVQGTLNRKLGIEFRGYRIFAVCHPESARRVLDRDLDAGVLLPCNVVVYEDAHGDAIVVAVDPMKVIAGVTGDPYIREVAMEVRDRLVKAVDELAQAPASAGSLPATAARGGR